VEKICILGMRKDWIRSEEVKQLKRLQLLEKNRRRKYLEETIEVCLFFSNQLLFIFIIFI
jgi:hypothetical protein